MTATTAAPAGTPALPAAGGERPRNLIATGTAFVAAGGLTYFGALVGIYIHLRANSRPWPPQGVTFDNYIGNLLVITMLLGSITVQWAVSAVKLDLRRQATAALGLTIGMGVAFLNLLSYSAGRQSFGPADHAYGTIVTALAASVGIVVLLGIAFCLLTMFRVRGSQVTAAEPDQAWATAWFWHFATAATIAAWYAVVVVK
jgi:cytochrome c oxidase subunit 3